MSHPRLRVQLQPVLLAVLVAWVPLDALAATITFDENPAWATPGVDKPALRDELNAYYGVLGVGFSGSGPNNPLDELLLMWVETPAIPNDPPPSNALAPGAVRAGSVGGLLRISFLTPVEEAYGLIVASGGAQPGVRIRAFNASGIQIGPDLWNDFQAVDEDWRFTMPDGQMISYVEFQDVSQGFALDYFAFVVPEPSTGLLVTTSLVLLAAQRRKREPR